MRGWLGELCRPCGNTGHPLLGYSVGANFKFVFDLYM